MGKFASTILALTLVAGSSLLSAPSKAENGQIAASVVGGLLGGALIGGALASSRPAPPPPPVYYEPAPAPVYIEEPVCRFVGERFWDGFGWQYRRVQVCN